MKQPKPRVWKAWAGFDGNRLALRDGRLPLYWLRKVAKRDVPDQRFDSVRRVEIHESEPKRRKRT